MSKTIFVEDVIIQFSQSIIFGHELIEDKDQVILDSFFDFLSKGESLTRLQGDLALRLLKKYHLVLKSLRIDYGDLSNPSWRQPFRILDTRKEVFVEENELGSYYVVLKFPFGFKSTFEKEYVLLYHKEPIHSWDHERKLTFVPLYRTNIVLLHEFLKLHKFIIHDSFLDACSLVEELWSNQYTVIPHVVLENNSVVPCNFSNDAIEYWNNHKKDNVESDLLLARGMQMPLKQSQKDPSLFEKIAIETECAFWCKDFSDFFEIYKKADGVAVVMLDRSEEAMGWLTQFLNYADRANIPRTDIKACFRDDKASDSSINDWIKSNNLGGPVDQGKIFIFRNKPAKWLFTKNIDVKIIATNSLFPMTNMATQTWMENSNMLFYVGAIKASQLKEKKIVEL